MKRNLAKRSDTAMTADPADAAGVSLWRRVADEIERGIADGRYGAGAKLPGEIQIAELFRVNRHTVRRALAALAARGLVRAERGSGTYVEAQRMAYPIGARTRFSEIVGTSGRAAGGRLIASSVEPAEREIARRLAIKTQTPVIRLEALRHADRVPLVAATSWLPQQQFPDAARVYAAARSMTRTLAHFGVRDYRRASTRIVAALADATDAMRLELSPGRPLLVVDSVDVDQTGRPVLTTRARFAAERLELVIES